MAPRLNDDVVARIEDALRSKGMKPTPDRIQQLASNYGYCISTIYRHYRRIKRDLPPRGHLGGQRLVISFEIEVAIRHLLD